MAIFRTSTALQLERAMSSDTARASAPRVIAADYNEIRDRLRLEFDRGFAVAMSFRAWAGFEHATSDDLGEIQVLGPDDTIYFGRIHQSLSAVTLLADLTGHLGLSGTHPHDQPPLRVQGGYLSRVKRRTTSTPSEGRQQLSTPERLTYLRRIPSMAAAKVHFLPR